MGGEWRYRAGFSLSCFENSFTPRVRREVRGGGGGGGGEEEEGGGGVREGVERGFLAVCVDHV